MHVVFVIRAFDIENLGNFYALPSFQNHSGFPVHGHGNQIPASWQTTIGDGTGIGQFIGAFAVTFPMERYDRFKVMTALLFCSAALVFMQFFFATSLAVLCASQYLAGVFWGAYPVLVQTLLLSNAAGCSQRLFDWVCQPMLRYRTVCLYGSIFWVHYQSHPLGLEDSLCTSMILDCGLGAFVVICSRICLVAY